MTSEALDIEIKTDWMYTEKCNAQVKVIITENLVLNNACCEVIEGVECCDEFGYTLDEAEADIWTITLSEPFCSEGVIYSILTLDGDDIIGESVFTDSIEVNIGVAIGETYSLKGSKFGCPDIIYPLNLS